MNYSSATEDNGPEIRQLLTDGDLHHEDITGAQLKHFVLGWDGPKLVAVIGLEINEIYSHFIYCFYLHNPEISFTRCRQERGKEKFHDRHPGDD
jgi:hypothetical protein